MPARNAKSSPISPEIFRFFRDLSRNNNTPWMSEHRERYRAQVVQPLRALLDSLAPAARKLYPGFALDGRSGENFSRINRDIRFARDKTPYRPQMYFYLTRAGERGGVAGQLYAGFSASTVTAGLRIYSEGRDGVLARFGAPRAAAHPDWLARQRKRLARKYESYWYATEKGQWTKHPGWPLEAAEWKKLKGWIVRRQLSPAMATRPDFPRRLASIYRELFPIYSFVSLPEWKSPPKRK